MPNQIKNWRINTMKKQLLFITLALSSQLYAETLQDALNQLQGSGQEFLTIVNSAPIPEFQTKNRTRLNRMLSQDINTLTPDQIQAAMDGIDSLVNTISPFINQIPDYKTLSKDDFNTLAEEAKSELQELIEEAMQQAELKRITNLQPLAEDASIPTRVTPVLSMDTRDSTPEGGNESLNDTLATLQEELKILDETSSSDVDAVLLNYGGTFEDFMNEQRMSITTEQEYHNALRLFLNEKRLTFEEALLVEIATKLRAIQTRYLLDDELDAESSTDPLVDDTVDTVSFEDFNLPSPRHSLARGMSITPSVTQEIDGTGDESIDALLAQLTPEQSAQLLHEIRLEEFAKNVQKLNSASTDTNTAAFVRVYKKSLKDLVNRSKNRNNKPFVSAKELEEELIQTFDSLEIPRDNYSTALPLLTNALVALQQEMKKPKSQKQKEYQRKLKQRKKDKERAASLVAAEGYALSTAHEINRADATMGDFLAQTATAEATGYASPSFSSVPEITPLNPGAQLPPVQPAPATKKIYEQVGYSPTRGWYLNPPLSEEVVNKLAKGLINPKK
jgi:hypothetical protein